MKIATPKRLVLSLLFLLCMDCQALGLGELKVNSRLNEPFDATIELTGAEALMDSELIVQLGNEAAFDRMGVIRESILLQLQFKPMLKQSPPVIRVTSDKPIREPSLDFVVDLQSPKGQMMKEYTVLLSPAK